MLDLSLKRDILSFIYIKERIIINLEYSFTKVVFYVNICHFLYMTKIWEINLLSR